MSCMHSENTRDISRLYQAPKEVGVCLFTMVLNEMFKQTLQHNNLCLTYRTTQFKRCIKEDRNTQFNQSYTIYLLQQHHPPKYTNNYDQKVVFPKVTRRLTEENVENVNTQLRKRTQTKPPIDENYTLQALQRYNTKILKIKF